MTRRPDFPRPRRPYPSHPRGLRPRPPWGCAPGPRLGAAPPAACRGLRPCSGLRSGPALGAAPRPPGWGCALGPLLGACPWDPHSGLRPGPALGAVPPASCLGLRPLRPALGAAPPGPRSGLCPRPPTRSCAPGPHPGLPGARAVVRVWGSVLGSCSGLGPWVPVRGCGSEWVLGFWGAPAAGLRSGPVPGHPWGTRRGGPAPAPGSEGPYGRSGRGPRSLGPCRSWPAGRARTRPGAAVGRAHRAPRGDPARLTYRQGHTVRSRARRLEPVGNGSGARRTGWSAAAPRWSRI